MFTYIQTYTHKYIYTCTHIYICIYIHRVTCHIQQHMYVCVCIVSWQHTHPSLVVNWLQTATACHNDHVYARHDSVKHGVVTCQPCIVCMYMQSNIYPYIFDSNLIL